MRVQVAWVGRDRQALVTLDVPDDATVQDAVARSGLGLAGDIGSGALACAIFGRRVDVATRLGAGDRVEITRPLLCDPKTARRRRATRRAPGAPPGGGPSRDATG